MSEEKTEGVKFDDDKIRMDLLPPELLTAVADILTFGAEKYGDRNWEYGMDWSRPFGALMRHMWAWWKGENYDDETGKSHLWHAGCCIAFLIAYEERKVGKDDRHKPDVTELAYVDLGPGTFITEDHVSIINPHLTDAKDRFKSPHYRYSGESTA